MTRILLVLAAAVASISCDAAKAHVRVITESHVAGAAKDHFSFFLQKGSAATDVSGKWDMTMETPHGVAKGPLEVKQDGAKLTANWVSDQIGSLKVTGTIEGKTITLSMDGPNGQPFGLKGTIEAKKMSGTTELGGAWSATR